MDRINGAGHVGRRFVTEDADLGRPPTLITDAWLNSVQEEIVNVILAAGGTLDGEQEDQLLQAINTLTQKASAVSAAASGTVDAITANFTPAIAALSDHLLLIVRAGGANTSTTPTFTPASATIAAKTIVKGHNQALVAGDISGAGFRAELQYDAALDKWVLLNPANGVNAVSAKQMQSISASVAANALTLGLNPTSLDFRASALTNGVPNTRTVAASLSLVVPSGATLGTVSGQAARLALLAIDNAGTVELAVVNLAGGDNLDETTLVSTTAISAAADANNVIYSATARASVPFRVVGFVDIAEATAGTWATAPTTIQGQGGQALAAMQSLGYGQRWQDVKTSPGRALGTNYYNTTGRPILVSIKCTDAFTQTSIVVDGVTINSIYSSGTAEAAFSFIVPPNCSYSATGGVLAYWVELR